MTNWTNIHPDFAKELHQGSGKTYQQLWQEDSFTIQDARDWIKVGFKPDDYSLVSKWKVYDFLPNRLTN